MKISFIIPARNEEKLIGQTIQQFDLLKNKYDYEVIVSDGNSLDQTRAIAKELGAKVYVEKVTKNIAAGRNLGARHSNSDLFVFCDADTLFEDVLSFAKTVTDLFKDEKLVAATMKIQVFPNERTWKDHIFHFILNNVHRLSIALGVEFSGGQCQVVRGTHFWRVGGYDEDRAHGEDSFLFKKLSEIGKIQFIKECTILESPRRYRQIGHFKLIKMALISIIMQQFFNKKDYLEEWERTN